MILYKQTWGHTVNSGLHHGSQMSQRESSRRNLLASMYGALKLWGQKSGKMSTPNYTKSHKIQTLCCEHNSLRPSKFSSSTPRPLSETSTSSVPLSFSLMSEIPDNNSELGYEIQQIRPQVILMRLTNLCSTCIDTVLHQLFHSCGQSQHHLPRADLMYWVFINGLDGSGWLWAGIKKETKDQDNLQSILN